MKRPPYFLRSSHYISKRENPVKSGEKSRNAVMIPLVLMQFGSMKDKLASAPQIKPELTICLKMMLNSVKELRTNPKRGKKNIDADTLIELEEYARGLGVSQIGYTKVNRDFIFKGFEILYDHAMVLTMNMDKDAMKSSPSVASTSEIWRTYSGLGIVVNKLAHFLRERGYKCHPSPAVGGDVSTVPMAQDSGIGVLGKNGLLITPEFGPSQRLAAVFIDVNNLPVKTIADNDHLWIREYCDSCNICVRKCPGSAIRKNTITLNDGYPQYIEREKCAPHFSKNCCTCIAVCPFINGNYSRIRESFVKRKAS